MVRKIPISLINVRFFLVSIWRPNVVGARCLASKVPAPTPSPGAHGDVKVGDKLKGQPQRIAVPDESGLPTEGFAKKLGSPFTKTTNVVEYALARADDLINFSRRVCSQKTFITNFYIVTCFCLCQ